VKLQRTEIMGATMTRVLEGYRFRLNIKASTRCWSIFFWYFRPSTFLIHFSLELRRWVILDLPLRVWLIVIISLLMFSTRCGAQDLSDRPGKTESKSSAINVNWLYGAYVPRGVELKPLTAHQRLELYSRQTYTTWGIYVKTALFAAGDQASNSPPEWDGGGGYAKRFGSRYGQFAIQNTLSSTGNYLLGYEPRYDRCRCVGGWLRLRHALGRNFVTYGPTAREKRPQIALYVGAMGAGMIGSVWKPGPSDPWRGGYQAVLTQAAFGSLTNILGEFAPEIGRMLKRN
jgi:hypothetical protein